MDKDFKRFELRIPDELHARLVELARDHHQSLHSYLITVLENTAGTGPVRTRQTRYSTP